MQNMDCNYLKISEKDIALIIYKKKTNFMKPINNVDTKKNRLFL